MSTEPSQDSPRDAREAIEQYERQTREGVRPGTKRREAAAGGGASPGIMALVKQTFKEFSGDHCPQMAAALAYYTVFSLPPLLVLIITVAGLVLDPADVREMIVGQSADMIGPDAKEQLTTMIETANEKLAGGFGFGLLVAIGGLLFGATGAFAQLQLALNRAWEVAPDPEANGLKAFISKRLLSFGMILVLAFLLLVSLVLTTVVAAMGSELAAILPGGASKAVQWLVTHGTSLVVITVLFAAMFKILPDAQIEWKQVWVGAFVTAVLFELGKFLIGLYLGQSDPGSAYGQAGSLALILVWVYYSSLIVFLGAEFTQVWSRAHGHMLQPEDGAVRVIERPKFIRPDGTTVRKDT